MAATYAGQTKKTKGAKAMPQLNDNHIPHNYKNSYHNHYAREQQQEGFKKFLAISFIALLIFPLIMLIHSYAGYLVEHHRWICHLLMLWTVAMIIYEFGKRRK